MNPIPTGQVTGHIYAAKTSNVNFYLIKNREKWLALDAGFSRKRLERELDKLAIDPEQVTVVLLTHSDKDHTGGLPGYPRAEVYLAAAEKPLIEGQLWRFPLMHNKIKRPCRFLTDGAVFKVGDLTIEALLTPGHTPGSMCYLIDGKYLFTGDTLSFMEGKVEPFVRLMNMDHNKQEQSLRKLAALEGVEWILTAHFGVSRDFQAAFAAWK